MEDKDKTQDQRIKELEDCQKTFLSSTFIWTIFATLASLVVFSVGYSINMTQAMETKIEKNQEQYIRIEKQLAEISADITWIKRELNGKK
jgi:hypothetical protein